MHAHTHTHTQHTLTTNMYTHTQQTCTHTTNMYTHTTNMHTHTHTHTHRALTLKHMHAGLSGVPHGVHEDAGEELGEDDAHLGPHQLVRQHLGQQLCRLLAHRRVCCVAEQVQQVDQSSWKKPDTKEDSVFQATTTTKYKLTHGGKKGDECFTP